MTGTAKSTKKDRGPKVYTAVLGQGTYLDSEIENPIIVDSGSRYKKSFRQSTQSFFQFNFDGLQKGPKNNRALSHLFR